GAISVAVPAGVASWPSSAAAPHAGIFGRHAISLVAAGQNRIVLVPVSDYISKLPRSSRGLSWLDGISRCGPTGLICRSDCRVSISRRQAAALGRRRDRRFRRHARFLAQPLFEPGADAIVFFLAELATLIQYPEVGELLAGRAERWGRLLDPAAQRDEDQGRPQDHSHEDQN